MVFVSARKARYVFVLFLGVTFILSARSQVIVTTIAGTNVAGYFDSTNPAEVRFNSPNGLDYWAAGMIAVSDVHNHAIRLVDLAGSTVTYAGTNVNGYLDGSPGQARFNYPLGVNVNSSSELLVADTENDVIRRIELFGSRNVSTLAGSGIRGYLDGSAAQAQFNFPNDLVVDTNGNVFVTEFNNNTIRRIAQDGMVTTFAGTLQAGFSNGTGASARFDKPAGIAIDSQQNLYVTEWNNHSIRKITPQGVVTTFAGGNGPGLLNGPGLTAKFNTPDGITTDPAGNLYVVEHSNHTIRKIDAGGNVSTIAGLGIPGFLDGNSSNALFNSPGGIIWHPNGTLLVADTGNHSIRRIQVSTNVVPSDRWSPLGSLSNPVHQILGLESNLFALSRGQAIYASFDEGLNWTKVLTANALSLHPGASLALDGTTLLASGRAGIWVSTNAGRNWSVLTFLVLGNPSNWGPVSVFGSRYFLRHEDLYTSSDRGKTWRRHDIGGIWTEDPPDRFDNAWGLVRVKPGYFVFSTAALESNLEYFEFQYVPPGSGVDGIRDPLTLRLPLISTMFYTGKLVLIGSQTGAIFASANEGGTFALRSSGLPAKRISAFESTSNTVFCSTAGEGIFVSTNNLSSWARFSNGLDTQNVLTLYRNGNLLYAGTDKGIRVRALSDGVPAFTPTPSITIHSAVELEFATELSYRYQLQSSDDLLTWRNLGEPYQGTGQKVFRLESTRLNSDRYYRLRVVNQ